MMDPDYDLFVAICEAQSLSAAARRLHLSSASVSKRLQRLEERLGVRLILRTTRRLSLTARGEGLYRDLVAIRAHLKEAEERASGRGNAPMGPLRITAPTSFGRLYLPPVIAAFAQSWPEVEIDLNLSDSFVDLFSERFDLAIRIGSRMEGGLVAHRLAESRRVLCAAPAYLAQHGEPTSLAELADHRLLAADGQLPWNLAGPQGQVRYGATSTVATNSSEMVRELTVRGLGISLRSLWDVPRELADGRLVRVLREYEGSHDAAVFAVHTPSPSLPVAVRMMIEHLATAFREGFV